MDLDPRQPGALANQPVQQCRQGRAGVGQAEVEQVALGAKQLGTGNSVEQRLCAGQWPWLDPTQRAGKTIFYTPSVGAAPAMAEIILDRVRAAALPSK